MASATEVDAWRQGPSSGALSDPLSGLSAQAPPPGVALAGTWFSVGTEPLFGLEPPTGEGTWAPALSALGTTGIWSDWRPASGVPLTFGGQARFRALVIPTGSIEALRPSAGWTDGSAWLRWHSRTSSELAWSASLESSIDPDTLGPSLPTGDLGWLTGTGTGVGTGIAVQQTIADAIVSSLSTHFFADLRDRASLSALDQYPVSEAVDLRAGVALPRSKVAWLAELHARGARTEVPRDTPLWSQSTELRAGARFQLGPRWQGAAVVGLGLPFYEPGVRIQPNGAPRTRLGLDLRRTQRHDDGRTESTLRPGELVIAPTDRLGTPLTGVQTPGHPHRIGRGGEHIIQVERGVPIAIAADGHAQLTMVPPELPPQMPVWQPVLPLRTGDGRLQIAIEDTAGRAVVATELTVAGTPIFPTLPGTLITVEGLADGPVETTASGPLLLPTVETLIATTDSETDRLIVERPPGATRVTVTADALPVVGARLTAWDGLEEQATTTDTRGQAFFVLPVGLWKVRVDAEGKGRQEQTVQVTSDPHRLQEVPFQLLTPEATESTNLDVLVFDPDGERVGQASVLLGEQELGVTASGGRLRIEGLPRSEAPISVRGDLLAQTNPQTIPWTESGDTRLELPVQYRPGVARIRVRDADRTAIPGSVLRLISDSGNHGEPIELGRSGALETVLEPGAYEVLISAPQYGLQLYDLLIPDEPGRLVFLDITLQPTGMGIDGVGTQLTLRIVDQTEQPVDQAHIIVDGETLAAPAPHGRWRIEDLSAGVHALEVVSAVHQTWTGTVELQADQHLQQTIVLEDSQGLLTAHASYGETPLPALVRMLGATTIPPISLGTDGEHRFRLSEGPWEAVFSAPGFGIDAIETTVLNDEAVDVVWSPELLDPQMALVALPPRSVSVQVLDATTGAPLPAVIRALGREVIEPTATDGTTPAQLLLSPGTWELLAEVEGRGVTGDRFLVSANRETVSVDLVLGSRRVTVDTGEVRLDDRILFSVGASAIDPVSLPLIDDLARTLLVHPELRRIVIEGHTDDSGSDATNRALSKDRALAVRNALIARGVAAGRTTVAAYGATRPIADNSTPEGRMQNRRVVMRIDQRDTPADAPEP